MCDLWPWNVFHRRVIHLHFLRVVTVPYSINSNSSRCLDSSLRWSTHTQTIRNDIHQSNFVSIKDRVNFMLSLTVIELSRIKFFSHVKYGKQLENKSSPLYFNWKSIRQIHAKKRAFSSYYNIFFYYVILHYWYIPLHLSYYWVHLQTFALKYKLQTVLTCRKIRNIRSILREKHAKEKPRITFNFILIFLDECRESMEVKQTL